MSDANNELVSQRFIYARKNKGLTLEEVGKQLGVSKTAVLKWERGQVRKMKLPMVETLARIYDVSPAWLMGLEAPMDNRFYGRSKKAWLIPILGTVKAGYDSLVDDNVLGYAPIDKVSYADSENYFCLKVKGDSMQPELYPNDLVVVHKQDFFEDNDLCIVLVNGDEATIKRVRKIDKAIVLQPTNPNYDPLIFTEEDIIAKPVEIIGVVKELKRNY